MKSAGLHLPRTPSTDDPAVDSADALLARALILGDREAPHTAWLRFAPLVHRILKRTFGPWGNVEDIQQEVFIAFFRKVPGLRDPKSLRVFVLSITARTIRYELRKRKARRFVQRGHAPAEPAGPFSAPADVGPRQALVTFYAILERLNSWDRTAFSLGVLEGLELPEVANSLGISVSSTQRHLTRIWKRVAGRARMSPALASCLLPYVSEDRFTLTTGRGAANPATQN